MSGQEFIIALVAIGAGSLVLIVGISSISSLIKSWINRNQSIYDDKTFDRLAKAFTQYKKETDRRLQNLEAIVADDAQSSSGETLEQPHQTIEIEEDVEEKKTGSDNNNLKNMLRE